MSDGSQGVFCKDEQIRRAVVLKRSDLNGIDYVEVDASDHRILRVVFLKPVGPLNPANPIDPNDVYGLSTDLSKITIDGGTRIVGIHPVSAARNADGSITITVDHAGDFSVYTLTIDVAALDRGFHQVPFSFMASCPVEFDCRPVTACPPTVLSEPLLDYEAKDYASFRRMLFDLLPKLNPEFVERNPADLGIALVELLAYTGDRLSYFQDAVANEAYLDTLRQRISARRMAKLIDYRMHEGRNAWTYVHVAVGSPLALPQGTKVVSRIVAALAGETALPGPIIDGKKITAATLATDPALASAIVFETAHPAQLDPANNEIRVHTWGNEECCLRPGTTEVYVFSVAPGDIAVRPKLQKGDHVLFEEVMGPLTGAAPDADPSHRQAVQLDEDPQATDDPLFSNALAGGAPQPWQPGDQTLPLLRIHWRRVDGLRFPLCISARPVGVGLLRDVSVARGNIVLADHGLTTDEALTLDAPIPDDVPFRLRPSLGPLTMECQPALVTYDTNGRLATPRRDLTCAPADAKAAIALLVDVPGSPEELWTPARDLLESSSFDAQFVPEIDNTGQAVLRFGDGEFGRTIAGATTIRMVYRIGNGVRGNVGTEALAHLAPDPLISGVTLSVVRNPLPARGGVDPETIEEVRQRAPQAFRAVQYRAVTEADYANAAKTLPEVLSAVASFRWTGSWYTVFVGVEPRDPVDLLRQPNGRTLLSTQLENTVRAFLTRYRLVGYDLEIRPPQYVPLEIELEVCASPGYFRSDVAEAVAEALGSALLPDGRRGFFYPGNFVFGQPVYLSQVYAAADQVDGVDSVVVTKFRPYGQADNGELASGVIPMGPWQIAQLDNDPNFMEHGVLKITVRGGKL